MTGNHTQRYLRTEGLYREILDMICPDVLKEIGETGVRIKLEAITSAGKIDGRLSAIGGSTWEKTGNDRLIEDWQRIVDGA